MKKTPPWRGLLLYEIVAEHAVHIVHHDECVLIIPFDEAFEALSACVPVE